MKLYTVVVHNLQMCMKEYRCCLKFQSLNIIVLHSVRSLTFLVLHDIAEKMPIWQKLLYQILGKYFQTFFWDNRQDRYKALPVYVVIIYNPTIKLGTGKGSQDSTDSCSAHPWMADRGSPLDGGLSGLIWRAWSWTIVDMFGKCHVPCTLKTSIVDFEKE